MPELREVFEMVTKQTEPDLDSWKQQQERQRRTARNRKIGAIGAVAAIVSALVVVFVLTRPSEEASQPAHTGPGGGQPTLTPGLEPQDRIVVRLDGSTVSTVSGLPEDAFGLDLSSDGATIAFVTAADGENHIATIGFDGQGMQILGPGEQPALSADGREIAFVSNHDIYVMAADGSDVRRLTTSPFGDEFPQWSPDGTTIVYDNLGTSSPGRSGYSHTSVIMTVPASGGAPTKISTGTQDSEPSFSPDGSQIVFRSHADIWVMNADGTRAHRIARNSVGTADAPRWSPDGTKIAYTDYTNEWRAYVHLGISPGNWPVEIVHIVDLASGEVTEVGHLGMATYWNAPQWLPTSDGLLLNVARQT
jgi:Tol biopolymer transport system component